MSSKPHIVSKEAFTLEAAQPSYQEIYFRNEVRRFLLKLSEHWFENPPSKLFESEKKRLTKIFDVRFAQSPVFERCVNDICLSYKELGATITGENVKQILIKHKVDKTFNFHEDGETLGLFPDIFDLDKKGHNFNVFNQIVKCSSNIIKEDPCPYFDEKLFERKLRVPFLHCFTFLAPEGFLETPKGNLSLSKADYDREVRTAFTPFKDLYLRHHSLSAYELMAASIPNIKQTLNDELLDERKAALRLVDETLRSFKILTIPKNMEKEATLKPRKTLKVK